MLRRSDITLSRYLPDIGEPGNEGEDEEDQEQAPGSELLLKVKDEDVSRLEAIAVRPRLDSLVLHGFERRKGKETLRALQVPEGENPARWNRKAIVGYGVKIGGTLPAQTANMLPVYKGFVRDCRLGNINPSRVGGNAGCV